MHRIVNKNSTLMKKLIAYFLIIIVVMFSLNAYLMYGFKTFYSSFYSMLSQLIETHSISLEVDRLYQMVENYSNSGTQEYISDYNTRLENLRKRIQHRKHNTNGSLFYKYRDIQNMLLTFDERSKDIIRSYDVGLQRIYINQSVAELARMKGYIHEEVKNLLLMQLISVQSYYSDFKWKMQSRESMMYVLTGITTLMCLVFAFKFSTQISVPIHQLVLRLQRVSRGELNVEAVSIKTDDEINVLIDSFNHMIVQIRKLIEKIKEKANVEKQLKEQEIKNLEISNLLNQSELNFLQSQINPHFLFNTMNSIAVLAEIEEAPQTKLMLESMASMLRYNLKKLNENVTLEEECEIVRNYLYIQRTRFGNRIECKMNIDESILKYKVPSMILQPFVENAIIHGLEPKEGNGVLEVGISDQNEHIEITIADNGIGMSGEKLINLINNGNESDINSKSGIGVSNVVRRLQITYGRNVVEIRSELNRGTTVKMMLDKSKSL